MTITVTGGITFSGGLTFAPVAGVSGNKAIFGYGQDGVNNLSVTNLVNNTGVVATDTTGVGTARSALSASGYGTDKSIFGFGSNSNIINLVSKMQHLKC